MVDAYVVLWAIPVFAVVMALAMKMYVHYFMPKTKKKPSAAE